MPASPRTTTVLPALVAVLVFCAGSLSIALLHQRSTEALDKEVQQSVLNVGRATSAVIPLEALHQLHAAEQEGSPPYLAVYQPMQRLLLALDGVRFIYTARLEGTEVRFLVDSAPYGDHDGNGVDDHAYLLEPYADAPQALRTCLLEQRATLSDGPYTDAWGAFYSGFWPLAASDGAPPVCVGVDLDAASYLQRLGQIRTASGVSLSVLALLAGLAGLGVAQLRTREAHHLREQEALVARLQESNALLVQAQQGAEAASQAKSRFLATMSHEIRTPMHAVIGFNRLALEGSSDPVVHDWLEQIERSAQQLLGIINNILDISQIEAGHLVLEQADFPLVAALEVPCSLAAQLTRDKGLALVMEIPEALPWVRGDALRISQILTNLLGNAIKFTDVGEVRLQVSLQPDAQDPARLALQVQVSDTGTGMSPDQLARLGQAYEQGDSSMARRFGGTGLGLSIARALLERMGGTWTVQSSPGQGTTITVGLTLPKVAPPVEVPAPEVQGAFSGVRVLVVEDQRVNQILVMELLRRLQCQVALVSDGQQAVDYVRAGHAIDLILMDIQMPVMDGLQATREIRQLSQGMLLPIVAFSANAFEEDRVQARRAGMNGYLPKPFSPEQLREVVERYATQRGGLRVLSREG